MSPERPTVCQLLHTLSVGGAEMLAEQMGRRLRGDFRVVYVCLDDLGSLGTELRRDGFEVHVLGRREGIDFAAARRLACLLRAEKVDLVHANQCTPLSYALLAGLFGRRPPVVLTEHGRFFPDGPHPKRAFLFRLLLSRRDRLFAVGERVRQALIDFERLPASRIGVIYNGIDLGRFSTPKDRGAVRAELGLSAGEIAILQVARLDPVKDHVTAVRAAAAARRNGIPVTLLIAGEGPEEQKIRAAVAEERADTFVRLLGLRRDVPRLLAAADLVLLTSLNEGIPLTLIEAMAASKPVVATDAGGVGEVVLQGKTGCLAPIGDAEALARQIGRIVADSELRNRFGAAGRARAEAVFSAEQMHAAYRAVYDEVLAPLSRSTVSARTVPAGRPPAAASRLDR